MFSKRTHDVKASTPKLFLVTRNINHDTSFPDTYYVSLLRNILTGLKEVKTEEYSSEGLITLLQF